MAHLYPENLKIQPTNYHTVYILMNSTIIISKLQFIIFFSPIAMTLVFRKLQRATKACLVHNNIPLRTDIKTRTQSVHVVKADPD